MLNIIGGSYHELCIDPHWDELYGSGFRAAFALSGKGTPITLYTYSDRKTKKFLDFFSKSHNIEIKTKPIKNSVYFEYQHPLSNPTYYPEVDDFKNNACIKVAGLENVIAFGMIEGNAQIESKRVVYDPQNPKKPISFFNNGSTTEELVIVMNFNEACLYSNTHDIDSISDYLFNKEKVYAAIIKCGAEGAFLLENNKQKQLIPAYITESVWPIGTGDVFTSNFGYYWMIRKLPLSEAATLASKATACYANSVILPSPIDFTRKFPEFLPKFAKRKRTVYLAGPFFTMSQRWLINQFRDTLLAFGILVFSPFHDVGLGNAEQVVNLDLKGITKCDLLLAVIDGLDSGTIFEIGYARARNIPVIGFVENTDQTSLTMLEGTDCMFESDFSTCIYKTFWELYKV